MAKQEHELGTEHAPVSGPGPETETEPGTKPESEVESEAETKTTTRDSSIDRNGVFAARPYPPSSWLCDENALLEIEVDKMPKQHELLAQVTELDEMDKDWLIRRGHAIEGPIQTLIKDADDLSTAVQQNEEKSRAAQFVYHVFWTYCFPSLPHQPVYRLFWSAADINQSCTPNAELSWNEAERLMRVFVTKAIQKDDEIMISYITPWLPYTEIAKLLNFQCKCPACVAFVAEDKNAIERDEALSLFSAGLKTVRAFRGRMFGYEAVQEPSQEAADAVFADDGKLEITNACERMRKSIPKLGIMHSDLSIIFEVEYLINICIYVASDDKEMAKVFRDDAFAAKRSEVCHLGLCKGWRHPHTQTAYEACVAIGADDDNAFERRVEELKSRDPE